MALVLIVGIFVFLFILMFKAPSVALVSVWCMYAIEQWGQAEDVFFIQHRAIVNVVVGCLVLIGVLILVARGKVNLRLGPRVLLFVLMLFIYSYISILWVKIPHKSLEIWLHYWPYFVTFILLSPVLLNNYRDMKIVLRVFMVVGAIVVYFLLYEVEWFHRRIVFVGGNYNNEMLGNPLAVAQMAGYLFLVYLLTLSNTEGSKINWIYNIIKIILSCLCVLLIIKSGSRGQLFGLVISFVIFLPLVYKISSFKGVFVICISIFIVMLTITWGLSEFWENSERWDARSMEESMGGRFDNAWFLLKHWYKDPLTILFGLGNSASYGLMGIYPHFLPLEILGEEGLIGLVVYIYIILRVGVIVKDGVKITKDSAKRRKYLVILSAMVLYSFMLSLKQGSLLGNMEFFMAAILLERYYFLLIKTMSVKNVCY